jgi:nucleotide-binding universal stress UspA family protein
MFKTIVWATDGSVADRPAQRLARRLCDEHAGSLRIVHVVSKLIPGPPGPGRHGDEERHIAGLKATTRALRRHGIDASLHVVRGWTGSPAAQIADFCRAVDADSVVLAGRRRTAMRGAMGGSVTQSVISLAPCPVLVVPSRCAADGDPPNSVATSPVAARVRAPAGRSDAGRRAVRLTRGQGLL